MALKKNGQERNTLHLTLSLGERIYSQPTKREDLHKSLPKSCGIAVDETYTEMRPSGSLILAASNGACRSKFYNYAFDRAAPSHIILVSIRTYVHAAGRRT